MQKILIVAGGTGGHIVPGIQIGRQFAADSRFEPIFVCGSRPIEAKVYAADGISPQIFPFPSRLSSFSLPGKALDQTILFARAMKLLLAERPAAVLSMGGAVSFAVLTAAAALRIPIFLHESNAIPGRVNRFFSRFARKTFAGLKGFGYDREEVVGTPTKRPVASNEERQLVVCVGGSQGATRLNELFLSAANDSTFAASGVEFVLISGPGKLPADPGRVRVEEYCSDMPTLLSRTKLLITRSGSGGLGDAAANGIPAIMIPYPHAMDDHQTAKARTFESAGAGVVLPEVTLSVSQLASTISDILGDEARYASMVCAAAGLSRPESAQRIVDIIAHECTASAVDPSMVRKGVLR